MGAYALVAVFLAFLLLFAYGVYLSALNHYPGDGFTMLAALMVMLVGGFSLTWFGPIGEPNNRKARKAT